MNLILGKLHMRAELIFMSIAMLVVIFTSLLSSCSYFTFQEGFSALSDTVVKAASTAAPSNVSEAAHAVELKASTTKKSESGRQIMTEPFQAPSSPKQPSSGTSSRTFMDKIRNIFLTGNPPSSGAKLQTKESMLSSPANATTKTSLATSTPAESFLSGTTIKSSGKLTKEGFQAENSPSSLVNKDADGYSAANSDYVYSDPKTWTDITPAPVKYGYGNMPKPLPEGEIDFLATTKFLPNCCPSAYSNSSGCACLSDQQLVFLSERGGNNLSFSNVK